MKNPPTALGYTTTTSLALYAVLKFLHLKGAYLMMLFTGILIAIYFSLLFLKQYEERTGEQTQPVHKFGVLLFSILILAILLRFNHFWQISGWMLASAYTGFSFIFIPWLIFTNYKKNKNNLLKNIIAGLGLGTISISLFGYPMHFTFHHELFVIGNVIFFLIFLPWYILTNKKQQSFDLIFQTLIVAYVLILFVYGIFLKWPVTHLK